MKNVKWILYCTTCTENGKIYIGVHKTETPDKFDGYIGNGLSIGWNIRYPKNAYQNAIKKYGYSKFKRATLEVFDSEDDAYAKEAEIVNLEFIKRHDNYNTALGGVHPGACFKHLYQYDLDGNFIKEWFSVTETAKYFQCNDNRFNMAETDKRSAFQSYWTTTFYEKLDITEYRRSKHGEIYQYDLQGNFLKLWDSQKQIRDELKLSEVSLRDAVNNQSQLKKFYFLSEGNIHDIIKRELINSPKAEKYISSYTLDKKLKETYLSMSAVIRSTGLKQIDIKNAIEKQVTLNNLYWTYGYSEEYVPQTAPLIRKVGQYDLEGNLVKVWDSIAQCRKIFPRAVKVLQGKRNHSNNFMFKYIQE